MTNTNVVFFADICVPGQEETGVTLKFIGVDLHVFTKE